MNKYSLNSSLQRRLTILLYHGVTDQKNSGIRNYQGKHLAEEEFYHQMDFVNKFCSPLSIDDWVNIQNRPKEIPDFPTIISFDDGFKNNLEIAAPILDNFSIPSIFYISSGMIDSHEMFWVDKIEDCIESSAKNNITIYLDSPEKFSLDSFENKIKALLQIKSFCKLASNSTKNAIIDELSEQTDVIPSKDNQKNYQTLSWNDLKILNKNVLFTIGGHTHSHSIMSSLEDDELNKEISQCMESIALNLTMQVKHFSYPEGQLHHFNAKVIALLKEKGIICCPSAVNGINKFTEDLFTLKRVMVGFEGTAFPHE